MSCNLGFEWSMIAHRTARVWVEVFDAGTNLHVAGATVAIGGSAVAAGMNLTTGSDGQATGDFGIVGNANSVGLVGEITGEVTASSSGTSGQQSRQVVSHSPSFSGLDVSVEEVQGSNPKRWSVAFISGAVDCGDGYFESGAYTAYFGGSLSGTFSIDGAGYLNWSTEVTQPTRPTGTLYATVLNGYGRSGNSSVGF